MQRSCPCHWPETELGFEPRPVSDSSSPLLRQGRQDRHRSDAREACMGTCLPFWGLLSSFKWGSRGGDALDFGTHSTSGGISAFPCSLVIPRARDQFSQFPQLYNRNHNHAHVLGVVEELRVPSHLPPAGPCQALGVKSRSWARATVAGGSPAPSPGLNTTPIKAEPLALPANPNLAGRRGCSQGKGGAEMFALQRSAIVLE